MYLTLHLFLHVHHERIQMKKIKKSWRKVLAQCPKLSCVLSVSLVRICMTVHCSWSVFYVCLSIIDSALLASPHHLCVIICSVLCIKKKNVLHLFHPYLHIADFLFFVGTLAIRKSLTEKGKRDAIWGEKRSRSKQREKGKGKEPKRQPEGKGSDGAATVWRLIMWHGTEKWEWGRWQDKARDGRGN